MSIEEMISFLEVHIKRDTERNKIITALKAGQAMRNEVKYYYNDSTSGTRAWDAATKGDDK